MGMLDQFLGGLAGKAAKAMRERGTTIDDAEDSAVNPKPAPAAPPQPTPYSTSPVSGKPIPKDTP